MVEKIDEAIAQAELLERESIPKVKLEEIDTLMIGETVRVDVIIKTNTAINPVCKEPMWVCSKCKVNSPTHFFKCFKCGNMNTVYVPGKNTDKITATIIDADHDLSRTPTTILAEFSNDVKDTIKKLFFGNKYTLFGKVKVKSKGEKSFFILDVDSFEQKIEGLNTLSLTEEDITKAKELANDPELMLKLRKGIFGTDLSCLEFPMDSIILSMASSPETLVGNTLKNRGVIDILLVGSPARGKSQLLKRAAELLPKSRYATGSNASAIGLVGSVRKDELIGDYVLEPGVVPLCHPNGLAFIDELDKFPKDDLTKLNTQMDSKKIPFDKANIHRNLPADVSIIAAMNPKHGAFSGESILGEIMLKKEFQDRFDLIFNVDYFTQGVDKSDIAKKALKVYVKEEEEKIPPESLVKYFAYIRRINPIINQGSVEEIHKEYLKITGGTKEDNGYYLSFRLQDNLIRLARAYARLRCSEYVDYPDIKQASDILIESFKSLGVYSDKGLNIFTIERVVSPKKVKKADTVLNVLKGRMLSFEEIRQETGLDTIELDDIIKTLKLRGDIFEPQRNKYKLS